MEKEISKTHLDSLEQLLFKPWDQGNNKLMTELEAMCSFYEDGDMTDAEVQNLESLRESMDDFHALQFLLAEMDGVLTEDFFKGLSFRQDAENADEGQKPGYQSNVDLQPGIHKLEEIRKRLSQRKISTSILISYITRKARSAGHIAY